MNPPTRWLFAAQIALVLLAMIYIGFKYNPLWSIGIGVTATILWIAWLSGLDYDARPHPPAEKIEHWGGAPEGSENE